MCRSSGYNLWWPRVVGRAALRHFARSSGSPARPAFEREQLNQLWQMGFKSPKGWGQPVGPLSVIDDRSRYAITLLQTGTTRAEAVREQLVQAFTRCGLPEAMVMDHGTRGGTQPRPAAGRSSRCG